MTIEIPLVSLIIPVYNGERFVGEAIESALAQSWQPLEILVVDDGSTDATVTVLERYAGRIQRYCQANSGTGAARNTGIAQARGAFVAHLDHDDLLPPDSVRLRTEAALANPAVEMVSGQVEQFLDPTMDEALRARIACPEVPLPGVVVSAMLVRRELYERIGLLDTRWRTGADMDWVMRAEEAGVKVKILPDVVLRRRIHGANMGITSERRHSDRLRVLKEALDRRRGAGWSVP